MPLQFHESQQPKILARLKSRYGLLFGAVVHKLLLGNYIQLVTDADVLLAEWKLLQSTETDPGSTGYFTVFTVGEKKRVKLWGIAVRRPSGGTTVFDGLRLLRGNDFLSLYNQAAASSLLYQPYQLLPMEEGDVLQVSVSAYAAGGTVQSHAVYYEEDFE